MRLIGVQILVTPPGAGYVNLSSFQAEPQGTWYSAAVVPTPNTTVAATVALQPGGCRGPSNLTWTPSASSFATFLVGKQIPCTVLLRCPCRVPYLQHCTATVLHGDAYNFGHLPRR